MIKQLKFLKTKEWILVALCVSLIVLQVWVDLKLPDFMAKITQLVQTPNTQMREVWIQGGYMLACAFGSLVLAIGVGFISSRVSSVLAFRTRDAIFRKVSDFSMGEIKNFSTASLITRTTNDITQVQMTFAMALQLLFKAPIMAVWAIVKVVNKGWQWSVATGVGVGILVLMLCIVILFAVPKFKKIQKYTDELNGATRESLSGVRVVRAYNAEKYQEEKFNKTNQKVTDTHLYVSRIMAIIGPGMSLISNGLQLAIYWIGAVLINKASQFDKLLIFSDMVVYLSYAMQIVMSFMMLIMLFMLLPRAQVCAKRINEVLETPLSITDGKGEINSEVKGEVEFRNVSFKYPDAEEYVVRDVNFKASCGETIAFIGSTGSGKSTLINLIPRFYDATIGEVLINGKNIKDYSQKDLHNLMGYVPQKAVIFGGTIESNIRFGESEKEISEEDVDMALKIAQATSFVEKLKDKKASRVAQNGLNLSGGQKQRLAIARAIARKPEILIFDDSFSALDYKTDKALRRALKKQKNKATTFIVAQRIGTIIDADKIIVLDQGNVVGMGTHSQLLKECEVYREIALSQLSLEEVENA